MANQNVNAPVIHPADKQPAIARSRSEPVLTTGQAVILPCLLGVGFTLTLISATDFPVDTLVLMVAVILGGLWLANRTVNALDDRKLGVLGVFWLIKVLVTLLLLYFGWMPQLDPSSNSWGYDPQRNYQYSLELISEGSETSDFNQNYQGIIFYYSAVLAVMGRNPVTPALVNLFVTLLGTLFLIRCAYDFMPSRRPSDWCISYLMLVPEVLWYDALTSRESLMAILIIVAALAGGRYIVCSPRSTLKNTVLIVAALAAILAVRTSMVLPVMACFVLYTILLKSRKTMGWGNNVFLVAIGIVALVAGPIIQRITGGYPVDFLNMLHVLQSPEDNLTLQQEGWSEQSIGLMLVPRGFLQSMAFLPPRMMVYLASPLPKVDISFTELLLGNWSAWQTLMTIPTSAIMLLGFPYVLAGSTLAWRLRKAWPTMLIIPIAFWMTFSAAAGGNLIIHERYRVMSTLLLFSCMWLGYTRCAPDSVRFWAVLWYGLLVAGTAFYVLYKFL